jgi:hypothetical protein
MVTSTTNACKRSGWTDDHRIQAWAYGGYLTKMVLDSFDLYVSLHQHLLQMADVERASWDYVQLEIEHHTEELATIRDTADYRLQALGMIYTYLRDNHNGGWYSSGLQNKRNIALLKGTSVEVASHGCPKCGTSLHSGGRGNCPWKNCKDEQAHQYGQAAIRKLSSGTGNKRERKGKNQKDDDTEDEGS